jgi:hypothetical protein
VQQTSIPFNGCISIEHDIDPSILSEIIQMKLISSTSGIEIPNMRIVDIHVDVEQPVNVQI